MGFYFFQNTSGFCILRNFYKTKVGFGTLFYQWFLFEARERESDIGLRKEKKVPCVYVTASLQKLALDPTHLKSIKTTTVKIYMEELMPSPKKDSWCLSEFRARARDFSETMASGKIEFRYFGDGGGGERRVSRTSNTSTHIWHIWWKKTRCGTWKKWQEVWRGVWWTRRQNWQMLREVLGWWSLKFGHFSNNLQTLLDLKALNI